jgi:hypothetical protein
MPNTAISQPRLRETKGTNADDPIDLDGDQATPVTSSRRSPPVPELDDEQPSSPTLADIMVQGEVAASPAQ